MNNIYSSRLIGASLPKMTLTFMWLLNGQGSSWPHHDLEISQTTFYHRR